MVVTHEPWIVVLSVLVAIQGAYVGLKLALELPGSSGSRRRLLLAGSAVTPAAHCSSAADMSQFSRSSDVLRRLDD